MKEIIAIIRPRKIGTTRSALEKIGVPSMTATGVSGRGMQCGLAGEVLVDGNPEDLLKKNAGGMKYIPKRLLTIVVPDNYVDRVVEKIISVNQTPQIGDGKIFVCPIADAIRVRTSEQGENAVL
jgi:nitrogen regulatory protein PII 2